MNNKLIKRERRFRFGKNWKSFVEKYLNENRVSKAIESLQQFVGCGDFENNTFLDIGCGSGLFSLAAAMLNAKSIYSFDYDQDSVDCCERLKNESALSNQWIVEQGSILDDHYVKSLDKFDIVYSWGVLHHTGDMWKAISNAASLVKDGGLLYIAIYNKADGLAIYPDGRLGSSKFWLNFKKFYISLPIFLQNTIDYILMFVLCIVYILTLNNPVKKIKAHSENFRGMSWRIDIKDWLGGYPYEYASVAEIFSFLKEKGFVLENLKCNNGLLNNEFLFKKVVSL